MLEMFILGVTIVVGQLLGGYIMIQIVMKQYMSKDFIKKYTKMGMEVAQEITEEMEDDF